MCSSVKCTAVKRKASLIEAVTKHSHVFKALQMLKNWYQATAVVAPCQEVISPRTTLSIIRLCVSASLFYTEKTRCQGMQSQIRRFILLFWRHVQVCSISHYLVSFMWTLRAWQLSLSTTQPSAPSQTDVFLLLHPSLLLSFFNSRTCSVTTETQNISHVRLYFCTVWVISVRSSILAAH